MTSGVRRSPTGRRQGCEALRLRPLGGARPLRVRVDEQGLPLAVEDGPGVRRVLQQRERWQIDDEWWRSPIHRIYHEVVLEPGEPMVLYHDLCESLWYRQ